MTVDARRAVVQTVAPAVTVALAVTVAGALAVAVTEALVGDAVAGAVDARRAVRWMRGA